MFFATMEVPSVASCNRECITGHSSRPHHSRGRSTIKIRRWAPSVLSAPCWSNVFSFLFSDTRRLLKLHNGGDHQHTRSQRSRIHHSTLPFEPHELQQLFLPISWACRNPVLKADHVLEHGSHLKAWKSAPTTPALACLSASTTSRIAG